MKRFFLSGFHLMSQEDSVERCHLFCLLYPFVLDVGCWSCRESGFPFWSWFSKRTFFLVVVSVQTGADCTSPKAQTVLLVSGSCCTAGRVFSLNWRISWPEKKSLKELQKSLKKYRRVFLLLLLNFWLIMCDVAQTLSSVETQRTEHWSEIFSCCLVRMKHPENIQQPRFLRVRQYSSANADPPVTSEAVAGNLYEKLSSTTPPMYSV